ncbi:hypothetical protein A2962_04160 [Candidatus Woesebacteria bacterium RIFCSPLOWO2_01_FULL_39_61]|uniref:Uncharacterized protein n=1 Tax=Candidatus Woesebacteria bacterium RIFCSPHIGHO2_02_FULL_39_13 TaxID=1802505 RepID=A0A1F7YY06_9BACT|nr:MAG: hypothetical protein A2692_00515 [Candidatus Woesebacteria bacterium RIFCSPHIGHO2_01_FULL_39_95]OGM32157.1 MAG: hypothetical protein A3D01_02100 [Candidatus Woesebacteria bacterium RIFCSPHIGHO2_02_FULL_39_13]OGM36606.1 MAG: hypothetical protein A3E13_02935 [Candidatus Woesebacteria bacterium RIFCSPHIGHO2_12_FULL_40_20]OGM65947.1 MAG: hypothetical protein A2962_04160 [Candidatus Woesebacteria bacterium RIFCSPLOWO2_01_FULL_39_61]OGM71411.1 MAG: hypothetical protein A3H19_04570 [Candidatus
MLNDIYHLKMTKRNFTKVEDIIKRFQKDKDKYISREFQKYGYELAEDLGDLKNKSLYIKLAKETPRGFLETARNFVKDAYNVKSRAKLFMWRLQQLKKESKSK